MTPASDVISPSATRTERRRARNHDALLAAARRLFATVGVEATTIAAITEAADLGFGTFYRYFADKEAILEAVLGAGRGEIRAVLIHADNEGPDAAAALTSFSARFARAVRRNHDVLALMWQVGLRAETAGGERVRPDRLPPSHSLPVMVGDAVSRIVERGVASGQFVAADARLASRFIASAHMYLLSPAAMQLAERRLVDALCEFELRALGSPDGAAALDGGGHR